MSRAAASWAFVLVAALGACEPGGPVDLPPVTDAFAASSWSVQTVAAVDRPTQTTWGPDGRLYVAGFNGSVTAISLDADFTALESEVYEPLASAPNRAILGIAVNPRDPPDPVRIYVAHGPLLTTLCDSPGPRPYLGQVSVLTGPDFRSVVPVVTGLPSSTRTHGVNGIAFDDEGDLFIAVGGQTNAGVPSCDVGGLPESPLSGAILRARTSSPDFSGSVDYLLRGSGGMADDQRDGADADLVPGSGVEVFAAGLRNPFDLVVTRSGRIYATDNGPNEEAGAVSISATEERPVSAMPDELNLLEPGGYYGHPNRNRGRDDVRQNRYRSPNEDSDTGFKQPVAHLEPSSNGVFEYRSRALGSAYLGALFVQQWEVSPWIVTFSPGGIAAATGPRLPIAFPALDIVGAPGGAMLGTDFVGNRLLVARPLPDRVEGLAIWDVHPQRIDPAYPTRLAIGGRGFGPGVRVTIGGVRADVLEASAERVVVVLPATPALEAGPVNVSVQLGFFVDQMPAAITVLGR